MELTIQNTGNFPLFDVMAGQGQGNMGQPNHCFLQMFAAFGQNLPVTSAPVSENSVVNETVIDTTTAKNGLIHPMANSSTHIQKSENPWKLLSLLIDHYETTVNNDAKNQDETQVGQKEQMPTALVDFFKNLKIPTSMEESRTSDEKTGLPSSGVFQKVKSRTLESETLALDNATPTDSIPNHGEFDESLLSDKDLAHMLHFIVRYITYHEDAGYETSEKSTSLSADQDPLLQNAFLKPEDMRTGVFSNKDVLDRLKFLVSSNATVGQGKNRETALINENQILPGHGEKGGSGNEIAQEAQSIGEAFVAHSKIQEHGTASKDIVPDKNMGQAGPGDIHSGQNRETPGVTLAQGKNPDQDEHATDANMGSSFKGSMEVDPASLQEAGDVGLAETKNTAQDTDGKGQNSESGIALGQKGANAAVENQEFSVPPERAVDRPTNVGAYPLSDMGAGKDGKAIFPTSWMGSSAAEKSANARDAAMIDNGGDIENGGKASDGNVTASTRPETQQEAFSKEGREKQDMQGRNMSWQSQEKTFRVPAFTEKAPVENQGDLPEPETPGIEKNIFEKLDGLSAPRVTLKEDRPLADTPTGKNNTVFTDSVKNEMSPEATPKADAPAGGSGKQIPNAGVFGPPQGEKAVSDKNLLGQIVNKAVLELGKNKSELKIDIKPENLGAVKIQVVFENHQIHAKITAENAAVKEIIEQNIEQLKQDLNKGGLAVDAVEVSVEQEKNPGGRESREEYARQLRNMARFRRNDWKLPAHNDDTLGTNAHGQADAGVDYYA